MVRIGLAERAVGDDNVSPDRVEDVAAMDGVAAALDEEHEEIEVAGDERLLASVRARGRGGVATGRIR